MKNLIFPLLLIGSAISPGFFTKPVKIIECSVLAKKKVPKKLYIPGLAGIFISGTPDGF